jgi:uncharacterized phiE125 gp8 family phage protein
MIRKLFTAPATEPLDNATVLEHLRLDSVSYATDVTVVQSIEAGDHVIAAAWSLVGASTSVLGCRVVVSFVTGIFGAGGLVDVKLQDSPDNATWTDVTSGAFAQVTDATDQTVYEKEYTGVQQYLRVVSTVAIATCDFGVTIIKNSAYAYDLTKIELLITTARQYMEETLGRAFITQTWEYILDEFPKENYIALPLATPLVTVTSVTYYDTDDVPATQALTEVYQDVYSEPGRIVLNYGETWPTTNLRPANGVIIKYVCGGTAASIPEPLQNAMMLLIGHLYENREIVAMTGAMPKEIPFAYKALVAPYQLWSF